jgi:hypothetical protein
MLTAKLTNLPTELLSSIINSLDGKARQVMVLNLCLVNRRLATVGRDELYISPTISPIRAHQLVAQLIYRPGVAAKTTELTVQHVWTENETIACSRFDEDLEGHELARSESVQALAVQCQKALQLCGIKDDYATWINSLLSGDAFTYIAVILAITPTLKQLTLSHQFASALAQRKATCGRQQLPIPDMSNLLECALLQLEELMIKPMQTRYNVCDLHPGSNCSFQYLDLGSLISVKTLKVPAHTLLVYPDMAQSIQIPSLPPNIQKLQITGCNGRTVELLAGYLTDIRKKCSELEEIDCMWEVSTLEEILGFFLGTEPAQHQSMFSAATAQGIRLQWICSGDT